MEAGYGVLLRDFHSKSGVRYVYLTAPVSTSGVFLCQVYVKVNSPYSASIRNLVCLLYFSVVVWTQINPANTYLGT